MEVENGKWKMGWENFPFSTFHSKKLPILVFRSLYKAYGPQHWWPGETHDEIIIGAILTQNTSWTNVEKAIHNLKEKGLCALDKIAQADQDDLAELIKPSGYFNQKAKRLIYIANSLKPDDIRNADLPAARKILLGLTGIGPETADSILLYVYHKPIFVIDAYTKRLFTRLGVKLKDDKYGTFQEYFMKNLPEDTQLYNEYHALIVRHAKYFCKTKPDCERCCLSQIDNSELKIEG